MRCRTGSGSLVTGSSHHVCSLTITCSRGARSLLWLAVSLCRAAALSLVGSGLGLGVFGCCRFVRGQHSGTLHPRPRYSRGFDCCFVVFCWWVIPLFRIVSQTTTHQWRAMEKPRVTEPRVSACRTETWSGCAYAHRYRLFLGFAFVDTHVVMRVACFRTRSLTL